jgi:hypothetical protein
MTNYIKPGKERELTYSHVIWIKPSCGGELSFESLMECNDDGFHPRLDRTVSQVSFTNNTGYGDPIPFKDWVSMGKPRRILKSEQTIYSPLEKISSP